MVNNIEISQLVAFIKSPEKITQDDAVFLKKAIEHYPYFQPLRLLLAKASFGTAEENEALASAALYNEGTLLHNFLHYNFFHLQIFSDLATKHKHYCY